MTFPLGLAKVENACMIAWAVFDFTVCFFFSSLSSLKCGCNNYDIIPAAGIVSDKEERGNKWEKENDRLL